MVLFVLSFEEMEDKEENDSKLFGDVLRMEGGEAELKLVFNQFHVV